MTVLILGGTAEARALAALLTARDQPVISSLAGRVSDPALPAGAVRIGGFGGTDGLVDYLIAERIAAIVDATHPFAVAMSEHAARAARRTGLPLLRLTRPGWSDHPAARTWTWVSAVAEVPGAGADSVRPFITTGRQTLDAFTDWSDKHAVVRLVESSERRLPKAWTVIRSRGPYGFDDELQLFRSHQIDLLVTKDSGGRHTVAKLDVAAVLGLPVVIVRRPVPPRATETSDAQQAAEWVIARAAAS